MLSAVLLAAFSCPPATANAVIVPYVKSSQVFLQQQATYVQPMLAPLAAPTCPCQAAAQTYVAPAPPPAPPPVVVREVAPAAAFMTVLMYVAPPPVVVVQPAFAVQSYEVQRSQGSYHGQQRAQFQNALVAVAPDPVVIVREERRGALAAIGRAIAPHEQKTIVKTKTITKVRG